VSVSAQTVRERPRTALFLVCLVALAAGFAFAWTRPAARPGLIEARDTPYNSIFVHQRDALVVMAFGHNEKRYTEAIHDRENLRRLVVPYTRMMTLPVVYARAAERVLEIGLGGGQTLAYLLRHMPQLVATGIELDSVVIELARKHFALPDTERLRIHADDGRRFLMRTQERFDVILVDAYRGSFVPFHLTTREFYQSVKARLAPGGVVSQNISPDTLLFDSAVATLRSVFDNVDLYQAGANAVAVAYDGPPREAHALHARAEALQRAHGFVHALPELLKRRRVLARVPEAAPLTDDFAPVETLHAIERHNRLDHFADSPAEAGAGAGG
jgi:spermidine synthase